MEYPKDINFKEYEDLDGSKVTTWTNNFHPIEGITEKSVLWKVIEHEGKTKTQFMVGFMPKHTYSLTKEQAIEQYLIPYIEAANVNI